MMQKYAQPMSPRTQAFAQGVPSGEEETKLFEDGLSQMAYNVLVSKFPDLVQDIITFRVLDTDLKNGAGVGVFVVQHGNEVLYIPVVMADNQIKPLDMFYHKGLNVFLPLNNDWLDEVSQLTLDEAGEAVVTPKSLRRNVDTRNIMMPPMTGRYAYAAASHEPLTDEVIANDIYLMLEQMTKEASSKNTPILIQFLSRAPDTIKEAFYNVLKANPRLTTNVALMYNINNIANALENTKTASATSPKGGALFVADKDTPATKFKEVFGDKAPEAYQGVLLKGYVAKDNRTDTSSAVQIQGEEKLKTPTDTGFYRVFTTDGDVENAFVIHDPRKLTTYDDGIERRHGLRKNTLSFGQHNKEFIIITQGGSWDRVYQLIAEPLKEQKEGPSILFNAVSNDQGGSQPKVGDRGIFILQKGQTWIGTEPFYIKNITSKKGVKRITTDNGAGTVLIQDKNASGLGIHQPKNEAIVYIPPNAQFIRLKKASEPRMWLSTPKDVERWFSDKFNALGAKTASIINVGAEQFSLNGTQNYYNAINAMKTAALMYNIPFTEAELLVKEAAATPRGSARAYILTPTMLTKMAQVPMMGDAMSPNAAQSATPGMPTDPSMQGAPPAPPAPPSPLDIAMGEAQTQIQQQMSDLQQQSMALQDKAQTLMMVQQRAQEVATGGQQAVQQGAAPLPMPGMSTTAAPMPMPGMSTTAPPQSGISPAPETVGGGMTSASMSPMTNGATMATETPSATEIQQQINPQFLESAADMADTGTFDAAAIASMAQAPSFRDIVVDYVPTLERALDNLGRVLLTLWMQEAELKERIGDEEYSDTEDNLRIVFEGLGKLILQINRNAVVIDTGAQPGAIQ